MKEKIKLYNVPRNSRIGVAHIGLKNVKTGERIEELEFKHIDGMYSLCYYGDEIVHLNASTEVYILN